MAVSAEDWQQLRTLVQLGIISAEQGHWLLSTLQTDPRPLSSWLSELRVSLPGELVQTQIIAPASPDLTPTLELRDSPRPGGFYQTPQGQAGLSAASSRPPDRVGPYQIDRLLGAGGAGSVYAATHVDQGHVVAIKFLHPKPGEPDGQDAKFLQEARLAAGLPIHPHIVRVIDAGVQDGWFYIVLEYIRGFTLRNLMEAGKVTPKAGLRVLAKIADALAHIHEHGIVHRDIKPENILIDANSEPRLTDFGIARREDASSITATSAIIVGTALYMAPEQAEDARSVDGRADIYAMGAVLYEILTGHPVFPAESLVEVLTKKLDGKIKPVREWNPDLSEQYEAICMKALARSPEDRHPSAAALRDALNSARSGDSDRLPAIVLDNSSAIRNRRASGVRAGPKSSAAVPVSLALVAGLALLFGFIALVSSQKAPELLPELVHASWWSDGKHSRETARRCEFQLDRPADGLLLRLVNEKGDVIDGVVGRAQAPLHYSIDSSITEGSWRAELFLSQGAGRTMSSLASVRFVIDTTAPLIELEDQQAGQTIGGLLVERNLATFTVNNQIGPLGADGRFSIPWPEDGSGLVLRAVDLAGNETTRELQSNKNTAAPGPASPGSEATPPIPVSDEPETPSLSYRNLPVGIITERSFTLRGVVKPAHGRLMIAEQEIKRSASGEFEVTIALDDGKNVIPVVWEKSGVLTRSRFVIETDLIPPKLELVAPLEFAAGRVRLQVRTSEFLSKLAVVIAGRRLEFSNPKVERAGAVFSRELECGEAKSIEVEATDRAGNRSLTKFGDLRPNIPLPPVAPPSPATSMVSVTYGKEGRETTELSVTFQSSARGPLFVERAGVVLAELRDAKPVTVKIDRAALRRGLTLFLRGERVYESLYIGPGLSLLLSESAWRAASSEAAGREKQTQELVLLARELGADFRNAGEISIKSEDERHGTRIGVFEHVASGLKFHLIPGGEVLLGISPEQELILSRELGAQSLQQIDPVERRKKGAKPVRVRPFLIAATEVSVAHWKSLGGESATRSRSSEEPITGISLEEAEAWLAGCPGGLRLPFHSEWEYACRGGKDTVWDSTDRFVADNVWGAHNATEPRSVKLHAKRYNSFGLCDMLGNASEWGRPDPGSVESLKLVASLHGGSFESGVFFAARRSPRVRGDAETHSGLRPVRGLDTMRINKGCWVEDAR